MKKVLVICAHPDDETLGLGGTLALHSINKESVNVLIFADGESARNKSMKKIEMREAQAKKACKILGIKKVEFLRYEDQKLDTIPLIEISKKIETKIQQFKPDILYTHFGSDVNQDHRKLFEATLIAARPTPSSKKLRVICFETPSSTEWGSEKFHPNLFVSIDESVKKKLDALSQYRKEMSSFPHPRSKNAVINRAKYWGSTIGVKYAEAFILFRDIIENRKKLRD